MKAIIPTIELWFHGNKF